MIRPTCDEMSRQFFSTYLLLLAASGEKRLRPQLWIRARELPNGVCLERGLRVGHLERARWARGGQLAAEPGHPDRAVNAPDPDRNGAKTPGPPGGNARGAGAN